MSFDIVLMHNASPEIKLTKELTTIATLSGVLREGTSILDPVVLVETAQANVVSSANYAYIAEFERYYYITNVRSDANGLWVISLHVDVLKTYETAIRAQSAIVARSANKYNLYLDDGWFMQYQNPHIVTKAFPNKTVFEHQEYILVLAGNTGANVNNGGGE